MAWDDAKLERAIEMYQEANPTAENTMDIVAEIAEALGESVNGTRMKLSKAGVYIKKDSSTSSATSESKTTKSTGTKVSKEAAQSGLIKVIEELGKEVDTDIISKLTGKAAVYFTSLLSAG